MDTARDINDSFGPRTTIGLMAHWWFKNFRSGDKSLEDDEFSGRPSTDDNYQLRSLVDANPCTTARERAAEFDITPMTTLGYLRLVRKTKRSINGFPQTVRKQKSRRFEVFLRLFCATITTHFLIKL